MDPLHLTMIGGGDRLDHSLAAIGALGAPGLTSIPTIDGWWADQHLEVLHGPGKTTLRLVPGSTLSLLALHGRCQKVSISGAKWDLDKVTLEPMIGRGHQQRGPRVDGRATGRRPAVDVEVSISCRPGVLTIFDVPALDDGASS